MSVHRNIRLLSWFNFFLDFRPYAPVVALYFAQQTGSFTLGMAVLSVSMVSSSAFEVPTGIVSDMVGRRKTMVLGGIAGTINILLWAIGGSFWVLALGSVFAGLARALFSGNNNALLYDTLKQQNREGEYTHFLGRTSSLFQAGLGMSAIIGGLFAQRALSYAMWAGVLPSIVCILIAFFMTEPRVHGKIETNVFYHLGESFRRFRHNARLRSLSLANIIDSGVGQAQFEFIPAFFALLWPLWAVGLARMLAHAGAFLSFWYSGKVMKRLAPFRVMFIGKTISHVVVLCAFGLRSVFSPLLISCMSLFFGVNTVAENTLLNREFTDAQRATMASLNQFAGSLLFALAALGLGYLADATSITTAMIVSELMLLFTILLYWRALRRG